MKEWPLVLFTLAVQIACGLTLAATVFETPDRSADAGLMRPLASAIFPILALGLAASLAHLGRPLMSWRALANLRHSRLSREILLTALFGLFAFAYSGAWWLGRTESRWILGVAASIAGIAAVIAGAMVHTVRTKPAWNSGWVPASFVGTVLLAGGLIPAMLIPWGAETGLRHVYVGATFSGSIFLLAAAVWMWAHVPQLPSMAKKSFWLGCYIATASVLPIAATVRLGPREAQLAITLAALFGAGVGRALMYRSGTSDEPF
jgi:anaerobic dimethyl sulfoxide reductase subunit C (anchor subunit)